MRKILNLYRLNFRNLVRMLEYLIKRALGRKPTEAERELNEYYNQLIISGGFLKAEDGGSYGSFFPEWKAQIKTRKWPSSDLMVFRQIFQQQEYKSLVETFVHYFSPVGKPVIIDAGSNIGLAALYLSRFFPDARLICIEPDAANFDVMKFNLLENKVGAAQLVKAGLWSRKTSLELADGFRDGKDWSIRVCETDGAGEIDAVSVQDLVSEFGLEKIDILKIDVEGSEKEIFTGPNADVSFLDITRCIAIEIHDEFGSREEICKKLSEHGFAHFDSGELTIGVNQRLV